MAQSSIDSTLVAAAQLESEVHRLLRVMVRGRITVRVRVMDMARVMARAIARVNYPT